MVTASTAPPPLSNSHAVLWLSSAPAQHHPIPGTHVCLLLSLFDSDQPPIKVAGYCQENRGKELTLGPHLAFPLPGFPFLFPHLPSLHHRFCVLKCPVLIFQPTPRGSSSVLFLILTDLIFLGIFVNFLETFSALSSPCSSACPCACLLKDPSHFSPPPPHILCSKAYLD